VAVEFIDEIPRSAAGKALRRLLRDRETMPLTEKSLSGIVE
jgi:acyl-CoA synthetase (AMP-forming)/AMP-acid ligase II